MTEMQVLRALLGLLSLVVSSVITVYAPKTKKLIDRHLTAKEAQIANHVIDGLSVIAENVVQTFNQKIVIDAKSNGVFTRDLAESVRKDAVASVKSQGASLLQLGSGVIEDVDSFINGLVQNAVVNNHVPTLKKAPEVKSSPTQPTAQ